MANTTSKSDTTQADQANARAKQAQADAEAAKRDAGKAENAAVSEAIYDTANIKGPNREAALGIAQYDDGSKAQTEATPKSVHSGDVVVSSGGDDKEILFLTRKAVELNVMVDPKWDAGRLRGEIQMALEGRADHQVKGVVPTAQQQSADGDPATRKNKVQVTLSRDYFQAEDLRIKAGQKIKVSREEAQRLIDVGAGYYSGPIIAGD